LDELWRHQPNTSIMAIDGHEQNIGYSNRLTKRLTSILTILLAPILTLFFFSAQAETTRQNEKFRSNPFPNPKTLMKLTTVSASSTIAATAAVVTALPASFTATVKAVVAPNMPMVEKRQNVAWFASSYSDWGFKYQLGSASIENGGFDCSGFVTYVLNYFDIKTKRTAAEQYTEGSQVSVDLARPGDLARSDGCLQRRKRFSRCSQYKYQRRYARKHHRIQVLERQVERQSREYLRRVIFSPRFKVLTKRQKVLVKILLFAFFLYKK
jgi:NlpC/P60 family